MTASAMDGSISDDSISDDCIGGDRVSDDHISDDHRVSDDRVPRDSRGRRPEPRPPPPGEGWIGPYTRRIRILGGSVYSADPHTRRIRILGGSVYSAATAVKDGLILRCAGVALQDGETPQRSPPSIRSQIPVSEAPSGVWVQPAAAIAASVSMGRSTRRSAAARPVVRMRSPACETLQPVTPVITDTVISAAARPVVVSSGPTCEPRMRSPSYA
jgi:hypothetical protein